MSLNRQREIFDAALDIADEAGRRLMLDRECGGNSQLRAEVEELLAAREHAEAFFTDCNSAVASSGQDLLKPDEIEPIAGTSSTEEFDDAIGSLIGPYKLLQKIGEGGCGIVYMAEQTKPVRRRVALKIIKLGMDTRNVMARFDAERQALAMMDHPNIARVLDAGATQTGRPYFVMELVRGVRITGFCDENHFDTRQRLELFIQVCQAIQHAHQKGIIHRDIKPSNILVAMVDGRALSKVIDFGIAKAMEEKLTEHTLFTMHGNFIGTPAYMSPEQAQISGVDVDTRSDIYSLGVLLYELLTGKTPFDQSELVAAGIDEMRRTLSDRDPHRPSTKLDTLPQTELTVTAHYRHVEPLKLRHDLQGDLDWIVMKALEKDRSRRYQTANGLAVEIQRYLDNEPVTARPPSRIYRFQKLVRRNKATFVAVGAVIVALIAGFGTSTWLFFREREARQEQVRLREDADQARNNEAKLRREAEAQAKITQAAYLISRGKLPEANALVGDVALPVVHPSLEAAGVFGNLAAWDVARGKWRQAADCLLKMVQANQIDKTDMTDAATRDLIKAGPVLVLVGDTSGYRHFIKTTIAHFSGTQNPVAAEQLLKLSTILPVDTSVIQSLEPMARVAEKSFADAPSQSASGGLLYAWRALALARFEYLRGDYANAIAWAQKSLAYTNNRPTCIAMNHAVLAMACCKLNQPRLARAELAKVRAMVKTGLPNGFENGLPISSDESGFWDDWIESVILLNEAAAAVEGTPQFPSIPTSLP